MKTTYAEYDRAETARDHALQADADDARDAAIALEMSETENDDGTITVNAIAPPVRTALAGWLNAVAPQRYATIAPGIAVRVGNGRKRRAA